MKRNGTMIRITKRGIQSALSCLRFNTLKQEEGRQTFKFIDIASKCHIFCLKESFEKKEGDVLDAGAKVRGQYYCVKDVHNAVTVEVSLRIPVWRRRIAEKRVCQDY